VCNNADAYLDLSGLTDASGNPTTDDGLSPVAPPADPPTGDYRAQITGAGQFLHTHVPDVNHASAEARQGSIQQLFYNVNFLHDWYYDAGFTEAMRNAQTDNFGRGGLGNDNVRAEVQDYSGFSNANMSTPSDGGRPRMQMYNFPNKSNVNEILAPAGIAGVRSQGVSMPGPQVFDVTGDVLIATFDASNNVTNAGALAGKIAMFDYTSAFSARVTKLNATSATAILMVWQSGSSANNVVNITGFNTVWSKPLATISFNSAAPIKTQLAVPNVVTMRLHRFADRDGALDNQVVFHEWGHYLSNRLISNAAGLSNNQGRSMGEGWGDFNSMMLTVRPDDINTPSNATWGGVYAMATYATSGVNFNAALNHGYYLGIRRTPYSTDMTNYNAFTFKHITNGQALPVGPPVASGGTNAEVHNSGEIWANTLWECYASLLRDTQGATPRMTFQQAQDRMKTYLVASLALTPAAPTFLEARDAVLAAAYANDYTDYLEFWAAFAKRGMGVGAVAPDRASTTHAGVVESFVVAPDVIVSAGTQLDDSVANCDADGVLDAGEYGKLTVVVKNVGSVPLTSTTATIATTTPGVSFPNGTTINFPTSDPLASVAASVNVLLAPGTAGMQQLDFQITVTDPTVTGSRNGTASFRANTDIIPASSATDTVEAETVVSSPWTLDFDPVLGNIAPFSILTVNPMSHQWFGPNGGAPSDNRLVSPVFTVDGSGSVTMQFDHTYSFENTFDGGVIEMSVNGGAWSDVGTNGSGTTNGYTVTLVAGGTNPLNGRKAYTGTLSTVTHVTIVRAVAPGSTVRFRFRTGADDNTAGTGWKLDNIAFSGVVETPFATLVADTGCVIATTTTLTASANPSPLGSSVTFTATVSSSAGAPTSGTVTFLDGGTPIGTGTVSAGVATYTTSSLSAGLHTMSARFEGITGFLPSTSTSLIENIGKIATGTNLVASSLNPTFSRPVTLTATVTATSGTPTGSVTFYDGATVLGTISLSSGSAALNISTLTVGVHNITASYVGNASYATSVTAAVTVVVETAKGDLSGEGRSDIVLQNSSSNSVAGWLMNGSTLATGGVINNPTAGWKPAATGDFDGDGMTDILLQNSSTGQIAMWKMNGLTLSGGWVVTTLSTDWRIVGTRDFNKDGKADVILQNNVTREVKEWQMNGATIAANGTISTPVAGWKVIATANVGGDALILQNTSTGQVARWVINGMTMTS
ncbi:MAG: M36 family metallopeptidase, partial [Acidobacteria bacterium]|nr:M36 family metallopeptidase [Acidobacteriota bacterium]